MTFSIFNRSAGDHIVRFSNTRINTWRTKDTDYRIRDFCSKFVSKPVILGLGLGANCGFLESLEHGHSFCEWLPSGALMTAGGAVAGGVIGAAWRQTLLCIYIVWLRTR